MKTIRWFRPLDLLPIVLIVVIAAVWFAVRLTADDGAAVRVVTPSGEQTLPLDRDATWTLVGRDDLTVTLCIKDGAVTAEAADCPDQVCVHTAAASKAGETIVCLPAGIAVAVEGAEDVSAPDAVAR